MDAKLQEVIAGKAPEYLEPLAALQENMQIRTKVAGKACKMSIAVSTSTNLLCILRSIFFSLELLKSAF